MALLAIASPQTLAFSPISLALSNKKANHVLSFRPRAPRVSATRRSCRLVVKCSSSDISRSDFPSDFWFGASTSALQTESGPNDGGRGSAVWDFMLGDLPAVDSLNKYKDDVSCLKETNLDAYRLSISWSRIFPNGKTTEVNQEGVTFYRNLLTELKNNGIEPFVTLFHFDTPVALQKEYNGFLSSQLVDDFNAYADFCFDKFGDLVKFWTTFNEPEVWCVHGYVTDLTIPDDPTTYPYKAAHNLLLAHATAVKTYRDKYQSTQGGKIGIPLSARWFLPYGESTTDFAATKRAWDFTAGWFLDPVVTGDYPFSMKSVVRERLPEFTDAQKEMLKGAYDFIGINYYTSNYAQAKPFSSNDVSTGYDHDIYATLTPEKDGVPIGPPAEAQNGIYKYEKGIADILRHLNDAYNNPLVYITENGYPQLRHDELSLEENLKDEVRIEFIRDHLNYIHHAIKEYDSNVKGYFTWCLMDCMEVGSKYNIRYGLYFTDYDNDYKRIAKSSANWLKGILAK